MSTAEPLLAFKAGRAFRREGTNTVDPDPTKGAIILSNGEDGLLHFVWRNRSTGEDEEDLILFPTDATFNRVSAVTGGRVYVLKFSSSDQRHFFWLQDQSIERDDEFVNNLNGLLDDPDFEPVWESSTPAVAPQPVAASSTPAAPDAPAQSTQQAGSQFRARPEDIAQLQSLLRAGGSGGARQQQQQVEVPEMSLTDILTPANLAPVFRQHPELIPSLFPHLPPDLPMPLSAEVVERIINSPQFRAAVSNLDQALRTGLLGGLVRSLGLPEEAGMGVGPFLRAIQEQADREARSGGESMQTD